MRRFRVEFKIKMKKTSKGPRRRAIPLFLEGEVISLVASKEEKIKPATCSSVEGGGRPDTRKIKKNKEN